MASRPTAFGSIDALGPADPASPRRIGWLRSWRGFMQARVFVGALLLLLQGVAYSLDQPLQQEVLAISAAYLVVASLGLRGRPPREPLRRLGPLWLVYIGVDVLAFGCLQTVQSGNINYTPLFALPVLMGAIVGTQTVGLGTTAAVTLLLLGDALRYSLNQGADAPGRLLQAALTGSGLFLVALLAHQLMRRLVREETLATQSRLSARMHAQANALVIDSLSEGILIVNAHGGVLAANPAALTILGDTARRSDLPFSLARQPAWTRLAQLVSQTFAQGTQQHAELTLVSSPGTARAIQAHTRLPPRTGPQLDGFCVMFLQDRRELEARIRAEKLIAMGRMSAAVAHEIRNPLAAITQASALLGEDLTDGSQRKLNDLVHHNAQRLARIVDDVLDVARVRQHNSTAHPAETLALDGCVQTLLAEWTPPHPRPPVAAHLDAHRTVRFNDDHLRRILVNLLDNAARYASLREASIQVCTGRTPSGGGQLSVWSDGDPLDPAVEQHLFEPFYSSESRSSGLGLYICRELCLRHGATLHYERGASPAPTAQGAHDTQGNCFRIEFAPT